MDSCKGRVRVVLTTDVPHPRVIRAMCPQRREVRQESRAAVCKWLNMSGRALLNKLKVVMRERYDYKEKAPRPGVTARPASPLVASERPALGVGRDAQRVRTVRFVDDEQSGSRTRSGEHDGASVS